MNSQSFGGELFLLVSGAGSELDDLAQRANSFASARAHEMELNAKAVTGWMFVIRFRLAKERARRPAGNRDE